MGVTNNDLVLIESVLDSMQNKENDSESGNFLVQQFIDKTTALINEYKELNQQNLMANGCDEYPS